MFRAALLVGPVGWLMTMFRALLAPLGGIRRRAPWIAAGILSLGISSQRSWAADYQVTNTNTSGAGSLQAALINANGDPGSTITFQNGLGTINVGTLPDLSGSFTINGGVGNTISGQGAGRIFFVDAPGQTIQINGLTLTNGLAQGGNGATGGGGGGGGAGLGGAVFVNAGNVIFNSVAFNNNAARGGNGSNSGIGGGGGGGGLGTSAGAGSDNADQNLLGAGGGGGAKTSAGGSATGATAGAGGGMHGGVSGTLTIDGNGGNATGADGGGGGGAYDPFNHNEGLNGGIGGAGGDFGGGGGGGSSINDDAGGGGSGGFGGGGGGGGGNTINYGVAGAGGAGGFGGGGGGSGGASTNIATIPGGHGGFEGGSGGSSNQGAGGGGAALGGAVFVRSGATASFTDVSMDAGSLTPGSGGSSPIGQDHNGTAGGTAGGALFLMGGNTAFTVSSATDTKTISGSIAESSASGITKAGLGTLILSGANSYSGGTTVTGGTLRIPNLALPGSTTAISSGAVLEYNDSATLTQPTFTFTGAGTLRKTGAGLFVFGGQGNINVNLAAGGLIDVQGGKLVGSSSYQGIWAANQASLNIAGGATFDAVEGGPSGTLQFDALTGAGNFTGGYFGAFEAVTTATMGVAGGSGEFSGSLSDDINAHLAIVKNGAGTQTLSGVNTYTGGTVVNGGKLLVNGSIAGAVNVNNNGTLGGNGSVGGLVTVASGGAISPGNSPGSLTVGSLTLQSGAQTDIELGGNTRGSLYDAVVTNGSVTLGGALNVALINNFKPTAGTSFDILDWGTLAGTFSSVVLPTLSGGVGWDTSQLYSTGVLSVASTGIAGDYNNNGVVDAADYAVWRANQGTGITLANDPIGGTIGTAQYNQWRAHFGQTAGSGTSVSTTFAGSAVPEPASILLWLLTLQAAITACRRR